MTQANCPRCGGVQFELEEAEVGSVTVGFHKHLLGFTLFKCANCGAVLGVVDGGILTIAKRQGFKP